MIRIGAVFLSVMMSLLLLAGCSGGVSSAGISTPAGSTTVNTVGSTSCANTTEVVVENSSRSGSLTQWERWRGTIIVTGDVLIGQGCRLTIEPGTIVKFSANTDDSAHGSNTPISDINFPNDPAKQPSAMSGIEVWQGELVAQGTPSSLITFTTTDTVTPLAGQWHSIAYRSSAGKMTLDYSKIEYAYYGVQVSDTANSQTVSISNNTIQDIVACGICMGVDPLRTVTLSITGNTIAGCGHEGIDLHSNAHVTIEGNTFVDNRGKFVADPTSIGGSGIVIDKANSSVIMNNTFLRNNTGINCVTNGSAPTISGNIFGIGVNANSDNNPSCPR